MRIDVDAGYKMSKCLSAKGLFVGQSSGAYLVGAHKVAQELDHGVVVTVFNDLGERYFSTGIWD